MMARLLVVDDEPNVCYGLQKALRSDRLEVLLAGTAQEGIDQVREHMPDVVILDVRLPDMSGLEAYQQIRQIDSRLPVIIITAYAATETAIEATKLGAFEYLLKPVDLHQLREVVERAVQLRRLSHVPVIADDMESEAAVADRLVGRSTVMQDIYKSIGRVAPQDVTVLILGESGTGKELVARALYQHSRRNQAPFLVINCAAIPEALLESELFGHERGAFTGADRRRIGKFEQANGGTMLLDEVGDMSYGIQAKLLRLLQQQQFERLGGNETIQTDVRVIAATNQDLAGLVAAGRFRQDLYYRLNVFAIQIPPLRERLDDLPLLVDYFVRQLNPELGRHVSRLAPETMDLLRRHPWPGNVRELQSTIKHALVHATGEVLMPECLPENIGFSEATAPPLGSAAGGPFPDVAQHVHEMLDMRQPEIYRAVHDAVDRVLLAEVLRQVKGSQIDAAGVLGVSRNTLRSKLRALGLAVEKQVGPDSESGQPGQ